MNSKNIISFLDEDSIKSLFEYEIVENKKDYPISKNFIIVQLKKMMNKDKLLYTATFRDKTLKYNGFLFTQINPNEDLKENSLINVELISPRLYSRNQSRVFVIKKYKILFEDLEMNNLPEATLYKEENNDIIITNKNTETKYDDSELMYTSLKQLTTFSRDFIIFVRILKKSEIKVFNTRQSGKFFYFIVLDKDENEMQCTCFNKAVDKFFNIISEGKIYEIKGGYVKINDKKFTTIKSDYKIVLDENSVITEKKDDGRIKINNLKIIKISDIQNINLYSIINLYEFILNIE